MWWSAAFVMHPKNHSLSKTAAEIWNTTDFMWRIVLSFKHDGPIFWRQKWEPLIGNLRKFITKTNRYTSKEKTVTSLDYLKIVTLLLLLNFINVFLKIIWRKTSFSPTTLHLFASKNNHWRQSYTCASWKYVNNETRW